MWKIDAEMFDEFWRWYREIDQEWLLDAYDLALGFYKGRYPRRALDVALKFAEAVRAKARLENALTSPLPPARPITTRRRR